VFQVEVNSTSDHDTQLFLASKIRVKGIKGWFKRLTRAISCLAVDILKFSMASPEMAYLIKKHSRLWKR
jgi:hypothetical protein